jgi:hypothetical protein
LSNKLKYLSLLILPILLFISARLLRIAQGPYYLNFEDPSYVYLINSLNVALRYPVGHFDHPGTTVQIIGAVIIRLYHRISNSDVNIIKDVLSRPEKYLSLINVGLILISSAVLFLIVFLTYTLSRNILLSLLIQLSPFVSYQIFYGYKVVASDNLLITASLCFTGILIYYLITVNAGKDPPLRFVIVFAVICGLGLATKISFFPLISIPLILINGVKNKLIFLLLVFVSFIIFVFPAISNYDKFVFWLWNLFLHSGNYGTGSTTVVDFPSFLQSIKSIFLLDPVFAVSYFLSAITLMLIFFITRKNADFTDKQKKELKLLLSIVVAVTIQIIAVAKQYRQHYMIPSLILTMLSLSLCASLFSYCFKKLKLRYVYLSIVIIILITSFYKIGYSYNVALWLRGEAYEVNTYVKKNSSNTLVISSFGSANKEFALAFGVSYSGREIKLYKSILSEIQNENIFYLPWYDEFFSLISKEDVRKTLQNNKKIIFQTNQNNVDKFVETLKKTYDIKTVSQTLLFSNKIRESVYEITIESSSEEKK